MTSYSDATQPPDLHRKPRHRTFNSHRIAVFQAESITGETAADTGAEAHHKRGQARKSEHKTSHLAYDAPPRAGRRVARHHHKLETVLECVHLGRAPAKQANSEE